MNVAKKSFAEHSYEIQRHHWIHDADDPERLKVHESWFREDTVDFWRHERMYEPVFKCLESTRSDSWLTVGDGRYGLDAIRMTRRGFAAVTASDLTIHLLKISQQAGVLKSISEENAENLSFKDKSFDYVLCKEAFHHFPRPMLALYEMMRVARKGVVLIEPQDPYIDLPVIQGKRVATYEADGNFVYSLSRRELEKVALSINLPAVAFKKMNDHYDASVLNELAVDGNAVFTRYKAEVDSIEARCVRDELKHNMLLSVIFLEMPDVAVRSQFSANGWEFQALQRNPYA
jgi:SAM-dependent methyltransferase